MVIVNMWQATTVWLNVISDALIALSYFSVPVGLFWVIRKRPKIPYRTLILMFSLFMFSCGITHLIEAWTVWHDDYGLHDLAKGITAIFSVATAILLIPLLPKIIVLRSPQELTLLNRQLQETIDTQKASQRKLQRTEERLRTFLQQAPDGILIILKSGEIEYSNNMINHMLGRKRDELNGKFITALLPERSKHKIGLGHNHLFSEEKALSNSSGIELTAMRKDKSEFPIEVRISPIESEQENDGEMVLATLRDITERKNTEEITRKEFMKLAHVSRLSTVGEMADGLAHELNQPLTAISNNLHTAMSMQKKKPNPDNELIEIMQENYESAQRAGQIIRSLCQLVSKDDGTKQNISINNLVASTVKLIYPEAKASRVIIKQELDQNLWAEALIDAVQVQQVMVNLGRNAIEALAEKKDKTERIITIKTTVNNPNTIQVHVLDNGPGLNAEVIANLFQPYITSKESGMGLGLSICRTIVESHGGRLWHEDIDNQGSAFCFTMPIITGEKA